ncbi:hypothetical protein [Aurantibacter sp.]|uniref:hypothetical protein n=1 Tax=Aurantibacter sp. TaxID=2807103 RepID=UPI0032632CD9
MRKIIVVFAFLISGLVFGQTTVTLEDQCNCEVLSGPDVTAPGMITPAGADLGDIYVNTNTGTIYFWDGDSWELTSTDLNTTNATLTEDGTSLILTDSDNNSVSILLSDIASSIDTNTTNVTFTVNNGTGTLDIMDSDSNLVSVALSDIATAVNTDNQTLSEVLADGNDGGGAAIINIANPTNAQDAATKAYVDALDTDDADSDPNNEIQDLEDVIGEDPSAGNNAITDLANPTNAQDAATKAYVDALDTDDADSDPTNELTNTGLGGPTGSPVNGTTYVDTDTGQLYVYDGTWHQVGGSATPAADIVTTLSTIDNITYTYISEDNTSTSFDGTDDQDGDEVALDDIGNNFTTDNVEAALAELAGRTDNDTQYTAGSGLDLTGTVFSAEISSTSGNALSVDANGLYVSNVDNVNDADSVIGNESVTNLAFDGTTLTLTQDGAANRTVNLSAVDTNTQYTAGSGLDLTGTVFSADISGTAGNILSVDGDGLYATQSDDQYDDEVPLRVAMDVDDAGKIAAEVSDETNVQEVIQAIAPITSKAARIFYPPSIAIDASTVGTDTVDLYAQYLDQFGSPMVASSGPGAGNTAPSAIPTYSATELYYYVTYADVDVFGNGTTVQNMSIDENGVLSYEVFNQPADYNSLINVVFVVK